MKKIKLFVASIIITLPLFSAPSHAGLTKKHPSITETQVESEQSFSEWFFDLIDF